jgi:hypothetical protein
MVSVTELGSMECELMMMINFAVPSPLIRMYLGYFLVYLVLCQ